MKARGGGAGGSGIWPVYEDFKPTSEWHDDAQSHNLIIQLSGFTKEQLRVSTEGRSTIRVRGERVVGGNKWSRFLEDFEVPQNSDMNSVRAKFHEGVLTITIPKKMVDKPTPDKEHTKGSETQHTSQQTTAPKGSETQQTSHQTTVPKGSETQHKSQQSPAPFKARVTKESTSPEEKQHYGKVGAIEEEKKPQETKEKSGDADDGVFTKKAVKGIAQLNEERQVMVNMGVAVLVIVSLTAFVTYKFVSADNKK